MSIEKKTQVGQITYSLDGSISVRTDTIVFDTETGEEYSNNYHRHVLVEGESDLSVEDPLVQRIAAAVWGKGA